MRQPGKRSHVSKFVAEWLAHPFLASFAIMLLAVVVTLHYVMEASQRRIIESEAVKIAEVVARLALASRTVYSREIADKLGAVNSDPDSYESGHGAQYAPLPAQFLKLVGHEASRNSDGLYRYRPLSRWNLDPGQGLVDDFQRWAWSELERQDQADPARPIDWQPVWRFESMEGARTLRYIRADAASNAACVNCHNRHEVLPRTHLLRTSSGVPTGKQWKVHQLLGAIEVHVPVDRVEAIAAGQTRGTVMFVMLVSILGLSVVAMAAVRDVRHKHQLALQFERQAKLDALTGLANRVALMERAQEALKQAARGGRRVGVMFIDLDNFKQINDSLGHAVGDDVLKETAQRLVSALRETDLVARYSGDEFAVVATAVQADEDLATLGRKLIEVITRPMTLAGKEIVITASLGIACHPRDGADAGDLLRNADAAMYRAKEHGRNNVQFFSPHMNRRALQRLETSTQLRQALDRNQLELHYQPKVSLVDGHVTGIEALVRWRHPERGLLMPASFIPLAEETGLIEPLGEWVLRTALAQQREWIAREAYRGRIAVNLSTRQFRRKDLADHIVHLLDAAGVSPHALELEITETMMERDAEEAGITVARLHDRGVAIAIDDFGVGYSSLGYLKRFEIDALKIDKSFVDGLPGDEHDAAITQAVLAMARALDIRVVAEGVENAQQRDYLARAGCAEIQGYLVSVPLPAAEMGAFLERQKLVHQAAPQPN